MKSRTITHSCGLTYRRMDYGKCPKCSHQRAVKLVLAIIRNRKVRIDEFV